MTGAKDTIERNLSARTEPGLGRDRVIAEILTSPTRRTLLSGSAAPLALAAMSAPGIASQAPAVGIENEAHPDHPIYQMQVRMDEADAESTAASTAYLTARHEFWSTLGPCPAALRISDYDYGSLTTPLNRHIVGNFRVPYISEFDDAETSAGSREWRSEAWTPSALQTAIAVAVPVFGQGGTTPTKIRHFRSLLPISEAFFARHDCLDREMRLDELSAASRRTSKHLTRLGEDFSRMSATTLPGLAIIAARMNEFGWEGMHASWRNLLRSAAAVTGVAMREPRFDVARWIHRLERVGGRWHWDRAKNEGGITWPVDHTHPQWKRDEITDLSRDLDEYRAPIRQWIREQAWAV